MFLYNEFKVTKKLPWPNLKYHPSICPEGLRRTTEKTDKYSRCPGLNSNWEFPELNSEAFNARDNLHC